MLKRNDLAKQFELVVKQEIKNYNDSLNDILLRLNYLTEDIKNVEKKLSENQAYLDSKLKLLEIEFEKFKEISKTNNQNLESKSNDESKRVDVIGNCLGNLQKLFIASQKAESDLTKSFSSLSQEFSCLSHNFSKIQRRFDNDLTSLDFRLNQNISKAKEEILLQPSGVSLLRVELLEKLSTHAINVDGLLKELRANKRDMMFMEKKIESIYTLIERLKKAGG